MTGTVGGGALGPGTATLQGTITPINDSPSVTLEPSTMMAKGLVNGLGSNEGRRSADDLDVSLDEADWGRTTIAAFALAPAMPAIGEAEEEGEEEGLGGKKKMA